MASAVVLISGRGSNLRSIVEARTGLEIRAVVSNRPAAAGLDWAREQGLAADVVDHKAHASREGFDDALGNRIARERPDYILLAGFMRILTPGFIERFRNRIVNIHPSLLPAFPGLHTHRQALATGVKLHGATVHFVTPALDSGPIIAQAAVPVMPGDTEEGLAARVLAAEHVIYPRAARWLAEGRVEVDGDVVRIRGAGVGTDMICSPRDPS
jgi:phosphoribosylglycinamide formyltransferase 1